MIYFAKLVERWTNSSTRDIELFQPRCDRIHVSLETSRAHIWFEVLRYVANLFIASFKAEPTCLYFLWIVWRRSFSRQNIIFIFTFKTYVGKERQINK